MLEIIRSAASYLASKMPWWRSRAPAPILPLPAEAKIDTSDIPEAGEDFFERAKLRKPREPTALDNNSGEFYFRESILDQLDYYFMCLARMKKTDRESYDLYSQVGGHVVPRSTLMHGYSDGSLLVPTRPKLEPYFMNTLPSFGAVFTGYYSREYEKSVRDKMCPRFVYFRKYDRTKAPPNIQRVSFGTVYVMSIVWDDFERGPPPGVKRNPFKNGARPYEYPVLVLPDGNVQVLRSLAPRTKEIRQTHGKGRGRTFTLPSREWVIADDFGRAWANENGTHDYQRFLADIFVGAANGFEYSNMSMIRITASKSAKLSAVFGVSMKRTPYFFKDREAEFNEAGNRKRIFHIVRPHVRAATGKAVKLHFRGQKHFEWNGYTIDITVPGRDHNHVTEFNAGIEDWADDETPQEKMADMAQTGAFLREAIIGKDA